MKMNQNNILTQFKEKVCKEIGLIEKGIGRYVIKNPFIFEDGDQLVILLIYDKEGKSWKITDEGHTFQHLSYFMEEKYSQHVNTMKGKNSKGQLLILGRMGYTKMLLFSTLGHCILVQ